MCGGFGRLRAIAAGSSAAEPAAWRFPEGGFKRDDEGADAVIADCVRGGRDGVAIQQAARAFEHAQALSPGGKAHAGFAGKDSFQRTDCRACPVRQLVEGLVVCGVVEEAFRDAQGSGVPRHGQHQRRGGGGLEELCDEAGERRVRREDAAPHCFQDGLMEQRGDVDGVGFGGALAEGLVQVEHAETHGAAHVEARGDAGGDPERAMGGNVPEAFCNGAFYCERALGGVDQLGPLRGLRGEHGRDSRGDGEGSEAEFRLAGSRHFFAAYRLSDQGVSA